MSQDNKHTRIADDFTSIAARMRELSGQSTQLVIRRRCAVCDNRGWVWSPNGLDRRRCPHCGMSDYGPEPQSRR